ncbi:hypothetical protein McanMca71_002838 [Microsporum canis]|uniref:Paramyosin n=1 Tax=Arthroderma otae (strain ATCC MYA-4605 / CBS 113480) TaxID=554155 RepID=C5FVN9_ARTOC|nr:uncharacterized protein MCYG_06792 [Microsporum canis CBS 113480]EEQ33973.1 predicted protein [Microsporum canis CBS 113480]
MAAQWAQEDSNPARPHALLSDASRDPRRISRNGPLPQNQPPTQDVQDTVQVLRQLTTEMGELTHMTSTRDRAIRKRKAEDLALKKAKERAFNYPSLLQSLGSRRNDRDKELKSIEDRLNTHTANKEKIILTLANIIHTPPSQGSRRVQVTKDLQKIEDEMHLIRKEYESDISTVFTRLDTLFQRNIDFRNDMIDFSDSIKEIKNGPSNNRLHSAQDDTDRRLRMLSDTVNTLKCTLIKENCSGDNTWESLNQKIKDITESLAATKAEQQNYSKRAEKNLQSATESLADKTSAMVDASKNLALRMNEGFENKISNLTRTVDDLVMEKIPALQTQVNEKFKVIVEKQSELTSVSSPSTPVSKSMMESMMEDMRNLSEQIRNFQKIQEGKNETLSKAVDEASQAASNVQGAIGKLNQDLVDLHKAVASVDIQAINQRFAQFNNQCGSSINSLHSQLAATHSAVHSLESRYSQIITEPIVRQMILRMQDMYPHASRVQSEIERLLKTVGEHLTHITSHRAKITALEEAQGHTKTANESLIAFLHTEKNEITGKMKNIQSKVDELEENVLQTLAEHGADLRGTMEDVKEMKAQAQPITAERPFPSVQRFQTPTETTVNPTSSGEQDIQSYSLPTTQTNSDQHRHKKRKLEEETPSSFEPSNEGQGGR